MQLALAEAEQSIGTTSPNPPVGAVIVRDGKVLGKGYHVCAGEPHAERNALADARRRGHSLKGAAIYVTLEPCSSYGRTPPCTEGIIEAGISRVVYGATDPDERHRGRADAVLQAAGVEVCPGVCKPACERLLRFWAHAVTTGRPWVTAKIATTLDGRITRRSERWLSSPESLSHAHELRLRSDAILVGGRTVRMDDPALTIRHPLSPIPEVKKQPWRIVLTRDRSVLPRQAKLFTDAYADRTLVLEQVEDWEGMLHILYRDYGIVHLLLECGGHLLRRFLEQGLVQEWVQDIRPVLGGGSELMLPGDYLPQEWNLQTESLQFMGGNAVLRGLIKPADFCEGKPNSGF